MPGIESIVEKLIRMREYINQLNTIKPSLYNQYEEDPICRYAIERLLQLIVDLALDINNIILSYHQKPPAADYFNSFIELIECGVLGETLALTIAPSTGLRNRLIHEYEKVDNKIVFNSIAKTLELYTKYMIEINSYIQK